MIHVGAPDLRRDGHLVWGFMEDAVTAAYELVRQAGIEAGTPVAVRGVEMPAWWWKATGLVASEAARLHIVALDGEHGEAVVITDEDLATVSTTLVRALSKARRLEADAAKTLAAARDPAPRACDFPLGAHVLHARYEEVLLERLRMGPGTVVTWTAVAPGAGPSEFERLQEAQGTYHVVMVAGDPSTEADGREAGPVTDRTVGLWAGDAPPETGAKVAPVVRRLFRRDGQWRYGVAFAPTL